MRKALALILFVVGVANCGPATSGVQIIKANIALSAAKTAGADRHAIFEYTAAKEYLRKSREEHGYSDFAASREYADKALNFAIEARKRASAAGSEP